MPALVSKQEVIANVYAATGSQRKAAELCGIGKTTVLEAVRSQSDGLATAKKTLAGKAFIVAEECLEAFRSNPKREAMQPMQQIVAFGISAQRGKELLDVNVPLVNINVGELSSIAAAMDSLRSRAGQPEPTTIDMGPGSEPTQSDPSATPTCATDPP